MDTQLPGQETLRRLKTGRNGETGPLYRDSPDEPGCYEFGDGEDGPGQPLSPMAQMFHERSSDTYIISIIGSKTKICPDTAKADLVHTLLKLSRFTSLQVFDKKSGKMIWVPTEVNLDDHVIVPKIEDNIESPDDFVEDYISNLTTAPLERSKPLWDLHLLDIKTSESEGVIIYRVHHSIGDGVSLMSIMLGCSRKTSDPQSLPTIPVLKRSSSRARLGFWEGIRLIWNTIVDMLLFLATALFLKDTKTPLKSTPTGEYYRRRHIIKKTLNLEDVKLVKNATNSTVNDVVLGVTEAGLSRYINRRYAGGSTNEKELAKDHLPKNIRLRTELWVNIRPVPGIKELVDMVEKGKTSKAWGNNIGYALLPLAIRLQKDPLDYVHRAKAAVDRKKASLEPLCAYIFTKFVVKFLGAKVAGFLNFRIFSNTTFWYSNVPGTLDEITYCGHRVSYFAPTCYGQPNGLMINVVSYMDKLIFVVSAEEETIPDPYQLWDDLEVSLKLIKDAALANKTSRKKH